MGKTGDDREPVPVLSVIVPCHNGASTLGIQLEALASQVGAPPFEVIVVDNASSDDLDGVIQQWCGRVPGLRVIRASAQQGVSYARNVGIGAARADNLLFCDADDCVSAYWVVHGWQHLRTCDLFSGSAISLPEEVFAGSVGSIREAFGDRPEFIPASETQDGTAHPVLMGGDFGMTRDVALRLRGFDQSLPVAGEDNDLAIRAQQAGLPVLVSPCSRIGYRARSDPRSAGRVAYRAAKVHAMLCARYGLWQESPHVQGRDWIIGPVRALGAAVKIALTPGVRDWLGIMGRLATSTGFAVGFLIYGILRRLPPQDLGAGIHEGRAHLTAHHARRQ